MTDFRATPEDWANAETMAAHDDGIGYYALRCILELRARVEALEAKYETQRLATLEWGKDVDKVKRWNDQHLMRIEALETNSKPAPNPSQIGSSLVERVHSCIVGEPECGHMQARAVIREVANWIKDQGCYPIADAWMAQRLEQEADRG